MTGPIGALVVDDNHTNAAVLHFALEAFGIDADHANCGQAALRRLSETSYAVVLLDYHMPDMDGAAVLRWIRENLITPPRVIVVTADNAPSTRAMFEELGCDGFLTKPISVEALRAVLEDQLEFEFPARSRVAAGGR